MRELRWTDWSEDHIARHGIIPAEVEDVVYSKPHLRKTGRNSTTLIYGTTEAGRHLLVVLAEDRDEPTWFVITSREMTKAERAKFAEYRKKAR